MYFTFHQYTFGTTLIRTKLIKSKVIVEADSAWEANEKMMRLGIKFNRQEPTLPTGLRRWYPILEDSQGTEEPEVCGQDPNLFLDPLVKADEEYCVLHRKDGTYETWTKRKLVRQRKYKLTNKYRKILKFSCLETA